ncbi:MAG TPA: type II toxin-antitoxin system VapC family toxin [Nocardioidaceae bacterium]|nr:type II toxin-antitoxin system VapC family toxin [Actinomycetota bacterium]HEV8056079.1 type II toxin-antitoxin system VapC family toxin [Nocardioidaceae bacterium]
MQIVDVNVLVYSYNEDAPLHAPARRWIEEALSGRQTVGFAWVVLLAFLRLTTRASLSPRPLSVQRAVEVTESWLAQPGAVIVEPTVRHLSLVHGLLSSSGTGGNLVNDAHLAALALEHRATVVSFDRDFGRFAGVRTHVPG